jgi:hypothetical protein
VVGGCAMVLPFSLPLYLLQFFLTPSCVLVLFPYDDDDILLLRYLPICHLYCHVIFFVLYKRCVFISFFDRVASVHGLVMLKLDLISC